MTVTTWKHGADFTGVVPGWNTASNWTNGVPTATTDAVLPAAAAGSISGDGPAASLTIEGGDTINGAIASSSVTIDYSLSGTHALGSLVVAGNGELVLEGALSFASATLGSSADRTGGTLNLDGGTLTGNGGITLAGGGLSGVTGVLSNAITLAAAGNISGSGTISGLITGSGMLTLQGGIAPQTPLVLNNGANSYTGGTEITGPVEVAAPGALGSGPVLLMSAFGLTLGAGVTCGPITVATGFGGEVTAVDANITMFAGGGTADLQNGRGASLFIGTTTPTPSPVSEPSPNYNPYGSDYVLGGTGRVTVFAGDAGGTFFGGTGGGNTIVAGADLSSYTTVPGSQSSIYGPTYVSSAGTFTGFAPVFIGGGGNGDLLVLTGTLNNIVAAAGGNETLTGASASGNNTFFGGSGVGLIVTGTGHDLVVAGSGSNTVVGGSGGAAIFAGTGTDVIVGGTGVDYVQAGSGHANVFTGAGADLLAVVAGQAGGSLTVSGFRVGIDHLATRGYTSSPTQAVVGGNTVLSFSDGTHVTLLNVASLPNSAFA